VNPQFRSVLGLDLPELERAIQPEPAYRARQIFEYVYEKRILSCDRMTSLPAALRKRLAEELPVGMPTVNQRFDSSDGTRRYLLDLQDGRTIETVLMPQDDRDTICISSQVGCPVDCKFCLTALMGLERNLTAGEIVAQVLLVMEHNGLAPADRRLNLVLMGMGEPLLNLPNVLKATRLLTGPVGIAAKRITLSTSGILPKMEELGKAEIRPRLAISLNASYEDQRRELMPITKKYHLKDLMDACRAYPLRKDEHLTFEYVLLKDVNDTDEDARRVVQLIGKLNCKVNLIALNPGPGIPFGTPSPERVASFQRIIKAKVPCYLRKPRGRDIYAACGQLKRMSSQELVTVG
jgi:23S rRNA (adenine2503-C2)-methyltransferase